MSDGGVVGVSQVREVGDDKTMEDGRMRVRREVCSARFEWFESGQVEQGEHVSYTFDPKARAWDDDELQTDEPPPEYKPPSLDE